jgi:hypothetical protein
LDWCDNATLGSDGFCDGILIRQGNAQLLHFPEQGGSVDAWFPGGHQKVVDVAIQCGRMDCASRMSQICSPEHPTATDQSPAVGSGIKGQESFDNFCQEKWSLFFA